MANRLNGKVAVVTEVSAEAGHAAAVTLLQEGAVLVANTTGPDNGLPKITGEKVRHTCYDVSTMTGAQALIDEAVEVYGNLDVLVNSVSVKAHGSINELTSEEFDYCVSGNVKAVFAPTKFAAIQYRQQRSGKIVNLIPEVCVDEPESSSLAATSEAVIGMTRTVGRDLGKYGVTCNAICVSRGFDTAAALTVLMSMDTLPNVNGCTFGVQEGSIGLYKDPEVERSIHKWGVFTLEDIHSQAPSLIGRDSVGQASLKNKVAIVTGAGRGIGRSVAMLMAREGALVVVNDLGGSVEGVGGSREPAASVVEEIRDFGGVAIANYNSVSEYVGAGAIISAAIDTYGRVDILCNAAGILRDRMVFNMTETEWDQVLRVHLSGTFNVVRHCVPIMMKQNYGRIALFSSVSGLGSIGQTNYTSAKEGIVGFTRSIAAELSGYGITINAIYPGANTRMMATVPDRVLHNSKNPGGASQIVASIEPQESLDPENNAAKISYLCTEAGGLFNGRVLGTNGWAMSIYSPRRIHKSIKTEGEWKIENLESLLPISLASDFDNSSQPEE